MSNAGMKGVVGRTGHGISRFMFKVSQFFSSPLKRKCIVVAQNVQILDDFRQSRNNTMSPADMEIAKAVIKEAENALKLASNPWLQSNEKTEKKLDEVATTLRRLGENYLLGMKWNRYNASPRVLAASAVVAASSTSATTLTTAAPSFVSSSNSSDQTVPFQTRVWCRGNQQRIYSDLSAPDHVLKKEYANDESLSRVIRDLKEQDWLTFRYHFAIYVRRDYEHRYTKPGIRWLRQKDHNKAITSLPYSTTDGAEDVVVLDVVIDESPFLLLIHQVQLSQEPNGIVIHCIGDRDNLDDLIAIALGLQSGTFHYQNLDGSGPRALLAEKYPKMYKCDWCILPGKHCTLTVT